MSLLLRTILIVLTPFAIYLLVIARINRRPTATVVSGVRDCLGLVLAFSGVLVYLGPGILTGFHFWPRDIWLYNHYSLWDDAALWWRRACVAYFLVVIGGIMILLWKRRAATAIYNLNVAEVERSLTGVLDRLHLPWTRTARGVQIRTAVGILRVDMDPSPLAAQVTLSWSVNSHPVRRLIERELAQTLRKRPVTDRRSGHRLMMIAACLFVPLFLLAVFYRLAQFREETGSWPWQ